MKTQYLDADDRNPGTAASHMIRTIDLVPCAGGLVRNSHPTGPVRNTLTFFHP